MIHVIVLSGGSGTRFWPLSRQRLPKQFLSVCSERPMIKDTLLRLDKLLPRENIYIAAGLIHKKLIKQCANSLLVPLKNCFFEPSAKNTFSPIVLLSQKISALDPDAVIAVLPSDHFIKDAVSFRKIINKAVSVAKNGCIVTLGITPKSPETGYGYIKIRSDNKERGFYFIEKFTEKPVLAVAKRFVKDRRYYWNAGMFIFKAKVMLEEAKKYMPREAALIGKMHNKTRLENLWDKLPSISIDYAIMEKSAKTALIPADFGWSDIGSWQALGEILEKDAQGNIIRGRSITLDCKNSLIFADKRLVAAVGVKDIVIVDTADALLVCAKDKAQDVKQLVELLKKRKYEKYI
ncbi:MAG: mannose-1-phosphate guanylyltransferase [Candidatus Omnitrophica bacterium]|nr:mannose-1-phosphate guanylyltransferase [Candidatus Omnitrophota bacterium]